MNNIFPSKVVIKKIKDSSLATLENCLQQALEHIGGFDEMIKPGMTVFLKPDLTNDYPSEAGMTTSPDLVAAVGRLVKKRGARVLIGDSPFDVRERIEDLWDKTGMASIARRENFELIHLEKAGSSPVAVYNRVYYIANEALKSDLVINLPRLRKDPLSGFAGALNNILGVIPGFQKGNFFMQNHRQKKIAEIVVDIYSIVQPGICIIDALSTNNSKKSKNGDGFVLVSDDAVALDTVLAELLQLNPLTAYTTRYAADAGLGIGWFEGIRIVGDKIPIDNIPDYRNYRQKLSVFINNMALGLVKYFVWMKAKIDKENCSGCGVCTFSCPTTALRFRNDDIIPTFERNMCINCWCCQTNCPSQTIFIEKSLAARKFFQFYRNKCVV